MSFLLGLTGSIGMGKSTTGQMFTELGYPLWDADAAVHRLYAPGGAAVDAVAAAFPAALQDGAIDRVRLKAALAADPAGLKRLESIVHPLVAADRRDFIAKAARDGARIVVLDIPLLFETGAEGQMDGVAVVSTDAETQRRRVLARPGMTAETFAMILSRQMPDAEKRARADWVIPTDTLDGARAVVTAICDEILGRQDA
ncbi:dephospho-CoA kinase [Paracoccus xiamenensis]|uniref:dephospho-CoA kinase n=1 Tax=Paracoccus xiamenensis TaxID=2714901 RepID=UPI0014090EEB|nr:dephospho-CoA kinase [Paracoccus xiamenensis]NHF72940.1 dephospho-CoA kinase [Paracoccus xiamenensis]